MRTSPLGLFSLHRVLGLTSTFTAALALAGFQPQAQAAMFSGISFSDEEIRTHQASLDVLTAESSRCLDEFYNKQQASLYQWGIGAFYGSDSDYRKLDVATQKQWIWQTLRPRDRSAVTAQLVNEIHKKLTSISCVDLSLKCLGRAFEKTGQSSIWGKLKRYTQAHGVDGSALQHGLQKLGWKLLYWNPNPEMGTQFDQQERGFLPPYKHKSAYGLHASRWKEARDRNTYYGNQIDDQRTLVGYGRNARSTWGALATGERFVNGFQFEPCKAKGFFSATSYANCIPETFRNVPLFVGTAHAGFHVFMGARGVVTEGHGAMEINNPRLVERGLFFGGGAGQSPRFNYYSGLIAVPPGYGL